ncbi:MAG: hypothetical protein EGQ71_01995 [Dialister sp.]|nr:hypothetical protein [Dialister sp.]
MNPHFFTAPFYFAFIWFRVQGSKGSSGWCGAFRHPERRKRSCVKNGLSENMRTESKDLSAAKYKNSLPLEGKVPRRGG